MSSILTNNGAMVALQTLQGINKNMAKTQSEISTGKSVASAKDNAAVWAISKVMESDVKGFEGIKDSLSLGESTVAVARNASESITDLLTEIKGKVVASQEENVDRAKLQTDIVALRDQIAGVVSSAQFNGLNMTDGSAANPVSVLSSLDRSGSGVTANTIDVATVNFDQTTGNGGLLDGLDALDVTLADGGVDLDSDGTNESGAEVALENIEGWIQNSIDAAASFGSAEKRISIQSEFVGKLTDSLKSGIGSMVDANMEEVSARLQALQVQQQLGAQSLSIANQAPQSLLSLFR